MRWDVVRPIRWYPMAGVTPRRSLGEPGHGEQGPLERFHSSPTPVRITGVTRVGCPKKPTHTASWRKFFEADFHVGTPMSTSVSSGFAAPKSLIHRVLAGIFSKPTLMPARRCLHRFARKTARLILAVFLWSPRRHHRACSSRTYSSLSGRMLSRAAHPAWRGSGRVGGQRRAWKKGNLSPDRVKRLELLLGWTWSVNL